MFRLNKPITNLARRGCTLYKARSMTPALVLASTRSAGTKGAPPISIDDLYGLYFLSEPKICPPVERAPQDMFDTDMRLQEVVVYLNGGLHAAKDKITEDFVRHMFESRVVFFPRDASSKPQEFRDILREKGGTEELPQLWIQGKLVASGSELGDKEHVYDLCTPARRPWPREGPYRMGFYNREGVTQSDKIIGLPQ
mmetsp:Transcript_27043/g.44407  ORF Transcript_27043/g.44407 Transcript_27043/m.44407 type:complete len:197 (+) Transcript_27043:89-679(+)|eukprot:CAMPEP_0202712026 /NCGR_PEP_ID=MMETSP1385-20130828/31260_1 /ASSEMBLY_ACC=CAM_ASM_000861 /TAXON_ID=933848 /ORGANISM="Elphidium margaritaceum" /LENGTH=196 /DNA_ID=CAMNT_0049371929 /DNA_START=81 /DNA_END=671 /DNA_ORIENTATION=-